MSQLTTNFQLVKPEATDNITPLIFAENFEKIDDALVSTYVHTKSGTVHNFEGSGSNGKAKITAAFAIGDTFSVNGLAVPAYCGADSPDGDTIVEGKWVTFTFDGSQLNFKGGGGLSNSKLSATTAGTSHVLSGKTFYSGNKTLKTGTMTNLGSGQAAKAVKDDGTNLVMSSPLGAYTENYTGYSYPVLYSSRSTVASAIGLTAAKLVSGNSVLGLTGTGKGKPALLCSATFLPRSYGASDKSNVTVSKTVNYYNSEYFNSSGSCIKTGKYSIMRFGFTAAQGDAYSAISIKVGSTNYNETGATANVTINSGTGTTCSAIYRGTGNGSDNRVVAVLAIFAET